MTIRAEDLAAPNWDCIHFTPEAPSPAALQAAGVTPVEIDGAGIGSEAELVDGLAKAFAFPDYFGGNWDAVDECLRDLSWLPAEAYALTVRGGEVLWRNHPALAGPLIRSWLTAAGQWRTEGTGFHLVFEMG